MSNSANSNGESTNGNGRDRLGRFQPGCPAGPGSPLAARAVAIKTIWTDAAREAFTPDAARQLFATLFRIATKGRRDRDKIAAAAVLLERLGIARSTLEELTGDATVEYVLQIKLNDRLRDATPPATAIILREQL